MNEQIKRSEERIKALEDALCFLGWDSAQKVYIVSALDMEIARYNELTRNM